MQGKDKHKHTLGDVILANGMNLNQELLNQGWCWWYRKYVPRDTALERLLEGEAREGRKGFGTDDPQAEVPWEWRRTQRLE